MDRICLVFDSLNAYKENVKSYLDDGYEIKYQLKNCSVSHRRSNRATYSAKNIVVIMERRKGRKKKEYEKPFGKIY